ncbi:MAG: dTMP kinase [Actinobacteria bacterium]|nr:dTMP kinase [Actinomycetota bacterium]
MGAPGDVLGGGAERAAYRALLRDNVPFRNLFFAMLSSSLGDWIGLFAILALTETLAGATRAGAFALSGIMVARVLPTLLLGPVAGVYVDRWDRKRTLIATDIGRGVVMIWVALVGDVFQLFVATFLIEVMSTLFIPAKDATLPNLVARERLVQANQLNLMVTYGTLPLGAAAFALLIGFTNTFFSDVPLFAGRASALPIWINAVTFFVSAWFIHRIAIASPDRTERSDPGDEAGAWTELREGIAFIATQPLIRALVVGVMAAFVAAGVVASGVGKLFVTIVNAGDSGFGVLGAVLGAGLFLGLAAAGPASRRVTKERLFAPGIAVAGVALVVTALMPRLDLATIPAFVMGAGAGLSFVTGYTMLQERSDDEIRGRTFAAFNTGVRAALFASLVVGPFLVGVIGLETAGHTPPYPYAVGGVRSTLILAGLVAVAGAIWTGRAIGGVLSAGAAGLDLASDPSSTPAHPGLFVVFEGGEGAGKSTQLALLREALEADGLPVLLTRQPGGTRLGELIRGVLLDPSSQLTDRAEALLFAADRAQHAEESIRPALEDGSVVLCDRYVDSSIVYQGMARGLGGPEVEELNRWGTDDLRPDLVVLLDVDPVEGLRRAGSEPDRMEAGGLPFHELVNAGFRRRAEDDPVRYLVLDAGRPVDDLHAEILLAVRRLLARHGLGAATVPLEVSP